MSGEALETLCAILENGGGRFRLAAYPEDNIEVLCRAGLVVRDGGIGSFPCEACNYGHLAEVRRSEGNVWGYRCPESGFVELAPQDIAAGQVHLEEFISQLADALSVTRAAKVNISQQIMPIGSFLLGEHDCFAYLAGGLSSPEEYVALHAEFQRRSYPRFGVVFMTSDVATSPFQLPANHHLISLREIVSLDADGILSIDWDVLRAFVPKTRRVGPGRPTGVEATWNVIQELIHRNEFPTGRNERQRAISNAYAFVYPTGEFPAPTTIYDHLAKLKARIDEAVRNQKTKAESRLEAPISGNPDPTLE